MNCKMRIPAFKTGT